jgi:hypothetical protein
MRYRRESGVSMRLLIDSLIAIMLVAVLAGIILHHRQQQRLLAQYQSLHQSLAQFREAVVYNGALDQSITNEWGYPRTISPLWFPEGLPNNELIPGRHPWIDLAPPGDMNDQPPDPIATRESQAGFWYNPTRGVIRARVTPQFTDQATLSLYNQINGTMLMALPRSNDPQRQPLTYTLHEIPQVTSDMKPRPTLRDTPAEPVMQPALPAAEQLTLR